MDQKNSLIINKLLFFIGGFVIISLLRDIKEYIVILFFLIFLLLKNGKISKKIKFYVPALIFFIPTYIVQSLDFSQGKIILQWNHLLFFRVITSLTITNIFISNMRFTDFCILLKFFKVPNFILELIIYMYKFINIFFVSYKEYLEAFRCRQGKISLKNISNICVFLFKSIYRELEIMEIALYSKGYKDSYILKNYNVKFNYMSLVIVIGYTATGIFLAKG